MHCGRYLQHVDTDRKDCVSGSAGQFISMYTKDGSKLLPRPISLCEIEKEKKQIRVVYRVTGDGTGTQQFSKLSKGDRIDILGPLGMVFLSMRRRQKSSLNRRRYRCAAHVGAGKANAW